MVILKIRWVDICYVCFCFSDGRAAPTAVPRSPAVPAPVCARSAPDALRTAASDSVLLYHGCFRVRYPAKHRPNAMNECRRVVSSHPELLLVGTVLSACISGCVKLT